MAAIQALLALHGDGLARVLELLQQSGDADLVQQLARDEIVGGLLLLHGLHPVPLESRVRAALDSVRPYLASHGGNVEVLGIGDGTLRLKLQGSCDGCASSAMTLKYAIEQAVMEAAPDLTGIEVAGVTPPQPVAGFIPLTQIGSPTAAAPGPPPEWREVRGIESLPRSEVGSREVSGLRLAFCRVGESWYAYRDGCPGCGRALGGARLDDVVLSCLGCGLRFDVRHAGRSLDKAELHLDPVPLLVGDGVIRVAAPAAAVQR